MMSVVHTFKLYELMNKYFRNDEDSKSFVAEMDNFVTIKMDSDSHSLATKSDIKRLEAEISDVKTDVGSLKTKIETVSVDVSRLEIKMGEGFKDILKWIIVLMVAFASLIITSIKLLP